MRESPYPLVNLEEAWRRIAAVVRLLPPVPLSLSEALGCVLAEDVVAREDLPPFPASAMDGYALIASDPACERRVIGEQDAGPDLGLRVPPGTAVRIMTGAPIPSGADAVLPVERAMEREGLVLPLEAVRSGQNVRPIGQDVTAGETVLVRGVSLGPAEIGLLASIGRATVLAHPKPRVAVLATGDELVPHDSVPGPGQIRNSNGPAIEAAVLSAGFHPVSLGLVGDNMDLLRAAILDGVARADALLTCGGVSMGERDYVKPLLAELGTVHFGRVAVKPGKPLTFAEVRGVPVFGLPGFPVSSLVSFEVFARPALRLMAGLRRLWRPEVEVRLEHHVRHDPDRVEFQRAVVTRREGVLWAATTGVQASGRLRSLAGANALLRLPVGHSAFAAGTEVTALLIEQPEVDRLP